MSWRDAVSPEQEAEIDGLQQMEQMEKDRRINEWGNLVRKDKTDLTLREFLDSELVKVASEGG